MCYFTKQSTQDHNSHYECATSHNRFKIIHILNVLFHTIKSHYECAISHYQLKIIHILSVLFHTIGFMECKQRSSSHVKSLHSYLVRVCLKFQIFSGLPFLTGKKTNFLSIPFTLPQRKRFYRFLPLGYLTLPQRKLFFYLFHSLGYLTLLHRKHLCLYFPSTPKIYLFCVFCINKNILYISA